MVPTRKKKQQNKRVFDQLSERHTDFMIEKSNPKVQTENRDSMTYRGTFSDNKSDSTQII